MEMKEKILIGILICVFLASFVEGASQMSPYTFEERYDLELKFFEDENSDNFYYINQEDKDCTKTRTEDETCVSKNGEFYVYMDETSSCEYNEFINRECGESFYENLPCVEEGKQVWPIFEECCEGLNPYSPPNVFGGLSCARMTLEEIQREKDIALTKYSLKALGIPLLIIIVLIIAGIMVYKKLKRKNANNNIK